MKTNKQRIPGLDSLRGIAVIGVILYHMFPERVTGGFLGVCLFFALSGYLLAITSKTAWKQNKFGLMQFYKKRILRIYPALMLTVCITVMLLKFFVPPSVRGIHHELLSIFGGYNNWWQLSQNGSYFANVNGMSPFIHLWSLAVELQYYLIWPLLFFICIKLTEWKRKRLAGTFLCILAAASAAAMIYLYTPGADPSRVYYGTDTRLFSLLLGSALGFCQNRGEKKERQKTILPLLLLIGGLILTGILFVIADGQNAATYQFILPIVSLLFLLLIYLISSKPTIGNLLDSTLLNWIGKYSYELYLCQYPLHFLFQIWRRGKNPFLMTVLELISMVCISILIHFLSINLWKKKGKFVFWKLAPTIMTATITLGGIYTILTVPSDKFSNDTKLLQAELEENAALLEMKEHSEAAFNTQEINLVPTIKIPTEAVIQLDETASAPIETEQAEIIVETETPVEITLPETPPEESIPQEAIPEESIPQETIPQEAANEILEAETPHEEEAIAYSPVASQKSDGITVIGDSVMLGAVLQIEAKIPGIVINAKISRQVRDAIAVMQQLDARGELGKTVVIALGSNGRFKEEEGQALLNYLGENKIIYWVTAYGRYLGFQDEVNATIQKLAAKNNNVTIIDWVPVASEHPEWFWDDGMHLNPEGKEGYAQFIVQSIGY